MKLQIDTMAKIIRLEDKILLKELVATLEKLLPRKEWQSFTLETNTVINNWNSPIVIREYKPYTYPWYTSGVTYYGVNEINSSFNNTSKLMAGTYNVEVK